MQTLLDTLMARARDKTSWTRACVCRTWGVLAEGGKVPMGHWNAVAEVAIGALSIREGLLPCLTFEPDRLHRVRQFQGVYDNAMTCRVMNNVADAPYTASCCSGLKPHVDTVVAVVSPKKQYVTA